MPEPSDPVGFILDLARRLLRIADSVTEVETAEDDQPRLEGILLQARRPFTNVRHVRQLLAVVSGDIFWVDRHVDLTALDIVGFAATPGRHRSFVLIREGRPEERIVRQAATLRQELAHRGIDFDVVCVPANLWDAHDRWIVASGGVWSLPPASGLARAGELRPSADPDGVRDIARRLCGLGQSVFGT